MHILDEKEARFLLSFALSKIPSSALRDIRAGNQLKAQIAREIAVGCILGQLALGRHKIVRPVRPDELLSQEHERSADLGEPLVHDAPSAQLPSAAE